MKIKLIATDLDGTLLSPDHVSVSPANAAALRRASDAGVKIVIASGRTDDVFPADVRALDFLDFALVSNGAAMISYPEMRHTPISEIPYSVWCGIYDKMAAAGADPEIYAEGRSFMDESRIERFTSSLLTPALVNELKSHITVVPDVKKALEGHSIEKLCVLTVPDETRDALTKTLFDDTRISCTSSIPGNIEANARGTSKGTALAHLADSLGFAPDEIMALGDAGNDIEMLKFAGCSVAMANASEPARKAARYTTSSNADDGVARAIRKFVFGEAEE